MCVHSRPRHPNASGILSFVESILSPASRPFHTLSPSRFMAHFLFSIALPLSILMLLLLLVL